MRIGREKQSKLVTEKNIFLLLKVHNNIHSGAVYNLNLFCNGQRRRDKL